MRELVETARQWTGEGRGAFLARPVAEQGFGPRDPGGAVLVDPRGDCAGSLYRGVFDAQLVAEAGAVPEGDTARLCEVSVHGGEAEAAGLTCGGQAEILLQPLASVPAQWWELLGEGAGAALVSRLDEAGRQAVSTVVRPGQAAVSEAERRAVELLGHHRAGRDAQCGDRDRGLVLIEALPADPFLVIGGRGELAGLIEAQARLLGWRSAVTTDVGEAVALLGAGRGSECLVMLSHDPEFDVPVLRAALLGGTPYVGALGSRKTQARRRDGLVAVDVAEELLDRVHGPIGLDLGARNAVETAMAVCAEVLSVLTAGGS
ncbi:XdhC family protein [Streptomyces bambusae]|uniref:XdhC family protein n=1 Tax=Streptomyces bambusae TaxID=1550616 RepID=UPI001CFD6544|nr:XdhC/CoxI family protein [Streptomyces bambusae]MCB5165131.1 XdhC family protein [Streptomyces bambusae]